MVPGFDAGFEGKFTAVSQSDFVQVFVLFVFNGVRDETKCETLEMCKANKQKASSVWIEYILIPASHM